MALPRAGEINRTNKLNIMPDITKCSGDGCSLKKQCYRFLAKDSEMQSYLIEIPFNKKLKTCNLYWEKQNTKK